MGATIGIDAREASVVGTVQAQSDSGWTQQAKLAVDDGDAGDWFGMTALDGTTAMVGAPRDDSRGTDAGSVYVFERDNGDWTQQAKLLSEDGDNDDRFGFPVAVDGTMAVVGARFDNNDNGDAAGAAYIFEDNGGWSQTTKLTPNDGDRADRFGRWVGIDGSTVVVGAITDEDPNGAGSAYVFERSDGNWEQAAKLAAGDGDEGDQFGVSVAVDGSTVVVGADNDEDPNGEEGGSAYVFEWANGDWEQAAKLTADDGEPDDDFGLAVNVDQSRVLVGAPGDQVNGTGTGSVYVFGTDGGTWTKQTKLTPTDEDGGGRFGISLDIAEGTAVVGADQNDNENGEDAGATYVYDVDADNEEWTQRTKLLPEDGDSGDRFGYTVSYDGTRAIVGARDDEDPNGNRAGSAYVFTAGDGDDGPQPVLELTASGATTTPGGAATVEFGLTNTGEATANTPGIQLGGIWTDPDWEITATDGDGGDWFEPDGFWRIDALPPQESQAPTVTLAVPGDASPGEYVVEADAYLDTNNAPVDGASATIQVADSEEGPPPLPGQANPPQDLDGDGHYEDVDGDGEFTIGDVQVFFQNRNSDVVQNNAEAFNFAEDDPPDVSIGDVQALFQLFQERG